MVHCKRIGHITLETPDVESVAEYYEQVIGLRVIARTKDDIFFSTRIGQLAVCVRRAASARCSGMSFEIAPHTDLSELQSMFSKEGIRSEQASDKFPGVSKSLILTDPTGTAISLFPSWSNIERSTNAGAAPFKLGHVAFIVDDPKKMAEFYGRHLGFRVSDWVKEFFVFMRCGSDHHTVNFLQGSTAGMHHVAFEMRDTAHLIESCETLAERKLKIIWGPVRHGPGHNVATYHAMPNGQIVELFTELDRMLDEDLGYFEPRPWHEDSPQRPKVWAGNERRDVWGPPIPADFLNLSSSLMR
jgi:catechol-2,3-dioxygenase